MITNAPQFPKLDDREERKVGVHGLSGATRSLAVRYSLPCDGVFTLIH